MDELHAHLILVSGAAILPSPIEIIGIIDVSWRVEVVARHELGRQRPQTGVWHLIPSGACQQERVEPDAAVGRRDPVASFLPPDGHDAIDRPRIEPGTVAEDDDCRLDLVTEGGETASKRSTGPAVPVRAAHDAFTRHDIVRAEHDDDIVDCGSCPYALQNGLEEHRLLR